MTVVTVVTVVIVVTVATVVTVVAVVTVVTKKNQYFFLLLFFSQKSDKLKNSNCNKSGKLKL